jgi:DNA-binding GntR family transcriptional regulator
VIPQPTGSRDDVAVGVQRLVLSGDGSAPTRGSVPEAVAGAHREAILDGVLEPGACLREAEVARELKVSRTPVRDAFRTLAAEGLVNINANQGAVVSPMTSDDLLELYVMREALEALAARLAARRAPRACRAGRRDQSGRRSHGRETGHRAHTSPVGTADPDATAQLTCFRHRLSRHIFG